MSLQNHLSELERRHSAIGREIEKELIVERDAEELFSRRREGASP